MQHHLPTRHPRELTPDEAHALDDLIGQLAGSEGRRRLLLGEALSRMERHGAAQELGFTDLRTCGYETIQQSKRWCDDSRRLATRLADLPILRAALWRNELSWSMTELLARVPTPDTEADLVMQARMNSLRAMREKLAKTGAPEAPEPERSTVATTIPQTDAWYFEATRMLVAAITDSPSNDELAEALLGEGLSRLTADLPGLDLPDMRAFDVRLDHLRAQMSVTREDERDASRARKLVAAEAEAKRVVDDHQAEPGALYDDLIGQLDGFVAVEVKLAHTLRRLVMGRPWEMLGYDSQAHYARERLGMSEATVRARTDLAYALHTFPSLEQALLDGRLGLEAARLIGRIADPYTIDAWIERGGQRTLKLLREDVTAAGLLSRVTRDRRLAAPPDAEALETVFDLERAVLAGVVGDPQMSVSDDELDLTRELHVTVKLSLRDDLARCWRALERVYRRVATGDMPFVTFLCRCVWQSWRDSEARMACYAYLDVYLRERFRCANPVCSRRDVTAHHIIFRAHGGGDGRGNLVALCSACHLEGVHRGRIRVTGQAPHGLRWQLAAGRVVVEGRLVRERGGG